MMLGQEQKFAFYDSIWLKKENIQISKYDVEIFEKG